MGFAPHGALPLCSTHRRSRGAVAFGEEEDTMERADKDQALGQIKEAFANVSSVILADYRGITVPVVTAMRDDFRKAGCHYRVLKNSLVKIAVKGSKMEPMTALLAGPT